MAHLTVDMYKRHGVAADHTHECGHECGETGGRIDLIKEEIGPRLMEGVEPCQGTLNYGPISSAGKGDAHG
jgi:hypothetical protein